MVTIHLEIPSSAFSALRLSPAEFTHEMRIAACVQWYAQGRVSQEKAAEIASLSRADFLEELFRRKVPAVQATLEELADEIDEEEPLERLRPLRESFDPTLDSTEVVRKGGDQGW